VPVTTVADLIDLLAARRKASILHDRRTGFPYSWSAWLRGWSPTKATAFAGADAAAAAPRWNGPRSRGGGPGLSFRQALLHLFRWAGDDPPPADQRRIRWFSAFCSLALHLLFAVLLVWVALVRSTVPEPGAEDGERVQVEYIGRGTPEEEGGGAPQAAGASASAPRPAGTPTREGGAAEAAAAASVPQPPSTPPAPQDGAADAELAAMPVDMSRPAPDTAAEQTLQVTEVPRPTSDFVLPPPTVAPPTLRVWEPQVRERTVETVVERPATMRALPMRDVAARTPAMPQVQVRERQIETLPTQPVAMAQVRPREAEVQLRSAEPAVRERQIETAPRQDVTMATVPARESGVQVKTADLAVRERQVPGVADATPAPVAGSGTAPARAAEGGAQQASPSAQGAGTGAQAAKAESQPGTSPGAGPRPQDRTGGWAAPVRSDDWGASQRQASGGSGAASAQGDGLFNKDGSVRLAGDGGEAAPAGRGAPGGDSDSWTREQIDRAGTWLKRPPYGYTPTSFDKYWVPNESLLAEWVRKGIKSIEIPIPGTDSRISCVVSILQFGGGCGLSNPNMQEQPASARPPPDIPFKKELQEDNGSR